MLDHYAIDVLYTAFADGDECVAIALEGSVGRIATTLSAQLLVASQTYEPN